MEKINKPNIREHDVIQQCRDCHMKMKQELLDLVSPSGQSRAQPPLKDFLFDGN